MKQCKVFMFNEHDGSFIAEVFKEDVDRFKLEGIKTKELEYDSDTHQWDGGNYLTGKLVSKEELSRRIYEVGLNQQCRNVIINEYPIDDQINNLTNAVLEIAALLKIGGVAVNNLKEQYLFIKECQNINKNYIEAYKNDPYWTFISKENTEKALQLEINKQHAEEIGVHSIDV